MNITEMLLTNVNSRPKKKIVPKGVVIHWTANERSGANATANRNYFNKPTTVASAHYIVDDKQIIRCLPEDEMGYHVGAQTYSQAALNKLSNYPNNCTIGIEMCVNADGSFAKMYEQTVALTADILKRHGWGVEHLWRHYDITGKNCPAFLSSIRPHKPIQECQRRTLGQSFNRMSTGFSQLIHKNHSLMWISARLS